MYTQAKINESTLRSAGEWCTWGRGGEIKLSEWRQNNSVVLFNDNNQQYSVVSQTPFWGNNRSTVENTEEHRSSVQKTFKLKTHWPEILCFFFFYIVRLSETRDCKFAHWQLWPSPSPTAPIHCSPLFLTPKVDNEHHASFSFCPIQRTISWWFVSMW